ncbi:glycosyltransferase family 4 protein [Candidatus Uhrbacteria bacterium]|jgi:glycosyltransferase involved in cell wall biosynthesis|nr:glycosyltransferase family 4 protein [Candidatus Uhrbacteria bacterium]
MKIGIVSNLFPPQARGGAELVAQRVADALYEQGHEVFVLSTERFRGLRSLYPFCRARHLGSVYRFFPLNFYHIKQDGRVPFPIRALWHLVDLFHPLTRRAIRYVIRLEEPDVIITHNLKGLGVTAGSEIQKQGIPHIHTLHDVQLSVPSGLLIFGQENAWLNTSFLRHWYEKGVRKSIGNPDVVISPSAFLADFYKARGLFDQSEVKVMPNPLPAVEEGVREERIHSKTRFLYVGQLEKHKGIMLMLDALEEMGDDVELHIAGDGALGEYVSLRANTDRRIRYHGFVSLGHLMRILQTSDAVLAPSLCYENSPTVIYEAFQIGVPVIASRIGGVPELIEDGVNGMLVKPGSKSELVGAMKTLHNDRDVWWGKTEQIHKGAQQYAIKKYVKRLEEVMNDIVKEN